MFQSTSTAKINALGILFHYSAIVSAQFPFYIEGEIYISEKRTKADIGDLQDSIKELEKDKSRAGKRGKAQGTINSEFLRMTSTTAYDVQPRYPDVLGEFWCPGFKYGVNPSWQFGREATLGDLAPACKP